MSRNAEHTENAPPPVGPYSQSARVASTIAVAGQGGFDPDTKRLVEEGVADQTRRALENIRSILDANGASMDDVIRVGVFLTDLEDFPIMNETYRQVFSEPFPARTTVYVTLPAGMRVEIDAIAITET